MSFKDKINNINVDEKGIQHDLISIKDSLLDSELLREKKKKENYGILVAILAHFILAINQLQLKTYAKWFKEEYTQNNLLLYRSFSSMIFSFYLIKRKNQKIPGWSEINNKFWFLWREFGAYIILLFYLEMTTYFRVSTCQCIYGCHPIIVLLLSIVVINFLFKFLINYERKEEIKLKMAELTKIVAQIKGAKMVSSALLNKILVFYDIKHQTWFVGGNCPGVYRETSP